MVSLEGFASNCSLTFAIIAWKAAFYESCFAVCELASNSFLDCLRERKKDLNYCFLFENVTTSKQIEYVLE